MSLKRLPSSTDTPTPRNTPPQRPFGVGGRTPHSGPTAPQQAARGHNAPPHRRRRPMVRKKEVIDAQQDPANPDVFIAAEGQPTVHNPNAVEEQTGQNASQKHRATATPATPEAEENPSPSSAASSSYLGINLRPLLGVGISLEGKFGLHVHLYLNLQALLGLLTAISVFSFTHVGEVEKWQRLLETFVQIFS